MEKILNTRNQFFDTYYIYDPNSEKYLGMLEDHCRKVKSRYFVGWHFINAASFPDPYRESKAEIFETEAEAIAFIQSGAISKA